MDESKSLETVFVRITRVKTKCLIMIDHFVWNGQNAFFLKQMEELSPTLIETSIFPHDDEDTNEIWTQNEELTFFLRCNFFGNISGERTD